MIGNNSASVLADAYLKGVKVEDVQMLYEGLINGTKNVHPEVSSTGRLGYEYYNKLGYVPYDVKINENTARTLSMLIMTGASTAWQRTEPSEEGAETLCGTCHEL